MLEPVGVCREDAKRPDGMTLIPWECGRSFVGLHMFRHYGPFKSIFGL